MVLTPPSSSDPLHDKLCVQCAVLLIQHHSECVAFHPCISFLFFHSVPRKPSVCPPGAVTRNAHQFFPSHSAGSFVIWAALFSLGTSTPANPVRAQSAAAGLSSLCQPVLGALAHSEHPAGPASPAPGCRGGTGSSASWGVQREPL